MAAPPKLRGLRRQDYPDGFGEKFLGVLHDFVASVSGALAGGLTRAENMRSVTKTFTFRSADLPMDVSHTLGTRPTLVWVGALWDKNSSTVVTGVTFGWRQKDNTTITASFAGLDAAKTYEVTLVFE